MLDGKIIVVTGGNGLIGKALVQKAEASGATVINLEVNVKTQLKKGIINCDITDTQSFNSAFDKILELHGKIDGWVNNAYPRTTDWGSKFEDVQLESWKKNVDMQLNSIFMISQRVLEHMKQNKAGSLVNIASIYGVVGNDFTIYENTGGMTSPAAYSAIKGGVINFSRYLASYYGQHNIRINCVSPGGIKQNQNPVFIENFEKKVPLKRMGRPEDIAPAVCFLLSDDACYITGQNLLVDGGWTCI
ncbi:MAG: SDR family oxidoreductase [Flavisolibacter sp.]|nr:SDR family oxidoreductase [Flavisolibacter sp.]